MKHPVQDPTGDRRAAFVALLTETSLMPMVDAPVRGARTARALEQDRDDAGRFAAPRASTDG